MKHRKGADQVEGPVNCSFPTGLCHVSQDEAGGHIGGLSLCHLQQLRAAVEANVAARVRRRAQEIRDQSMPAAQVEDIGSLWDPLQDAENSGLQARPSSSKGLPEALVESAVNFQQSFSDFSIHGVILMASERTQRWEANHKVTAERFELARLILTDVRSGTPVAKAVRRHPQPQGGFVGKGALVEAYQHLTEHGEWPFERLVWRQIRMKPMRTLSGVTTVTVLTKPYPCPGKCVFCPTDVRMPKSYLPDEPGAMRALDHDFDPYQQTSARIQALGAIGHPTDKVELLILGGTWSSYRRDYQEWFIKNCLDAMNGFAAQSLAEAQAANQEAAHRNVGLVIETRPDHVDRDEIAWLRSLGVTKVQMGAQSLDDRILELNKRGHTVAETRRAMQMMRAAGFKLVLHWMPNLLGATPESDRADFRQLWLDQDLRPDELKIYPNQLLEQAELHEIWKRGVFRPYTTEELIEMLVDIKPLIPRYCRVNRIIRDFPSTNVVEGNRRTSLRQDAQRELKKRGRTCSCIRCREIRGRSVAIDQLELHDEAYPAGEAQEHFLSYVTPADKIAGFVRLSLPDHGSPELGLPDLNGAALVRELHVYGQSLRIGREKEGAAQHQGLGSDLLLRAERMAAENGFTRMAVISALGTRKYYAERGYRLGESYMIKDLGCR